MNLRRSNRLDIGQNERLTRLSTYSYVGTTTGINLDSVNLSNFYQVLHR